MRRIILFSLLLSAAAYVAGWPSFSQQARGVAPTVTITWPVSGTMVSTDAIQVTGTAVSATGIAQVTVNGKRAVLAGNRFIVTVSLHLGKNVLKITATDNSGKTGSAFVWTVLANPLPGPTVDEFRKVPRELLGDPTHVPLDSSSVRLEVEQNELVSASAYFSLGPVRLESA
jgi:hypothetical protein